MSCDLTVEETCFSELQHSCTRYTSTEECARKGGEKLNYSYYYIILVYDEEMHGDEEINSCTDKEGVRETDSIER